MKTIQEYNLEGYKQKMLNGDLVGAMVELQNATQGLTDDQKAQVAAGLAGTYGMQGLLAVMGQTSEETIKFQNSLKGANQAAVLQSAIAATTSGKMSQLAATVGVVGEAFFSKFEPHVRKALDSAIEFARGLVEVGDEGYYVIKSLDDLAVQSKEWGKGLQEGIQNAISGIKEFVTGGGLDNILTIGTNLIQGICKGISNSKTTLKETFSEAIKKACKFISDNSEAIGQAGRDILDALAEAIRENESVIKGALDDLMGIITEWAKGGANLQSTMGLFADSMINALIDQAIVKATGRGGEIWNALWSGITMEPPDGGRTDKNQGPGITDGLSDKLGNKSFAQEDAWVGEWGLKMGNKIREIFGAEPVTTAATESGKKIGQTAGENITVAFDEQGQPIVESATKTGTDAATGIQTALEGMDLQYLQSLGQEMTNVGTLTTEMANSMSTSFTSIAQSAEQSFAQMSQSATSGITEATNSMRDGCTTMVQIMRNQAQHLNTAFREALLNVTNIARNQMEHVVDAIEQGMDSATSAIESGTESITNTIESAMDSAVDAAESGAEGMTSAIESGMSGMASAAKSQMDKVVSAVRDGMAQAKEIASSPITINITSNIQKKVTTTHVSEGLEQTLSGITRHSLSISTPNTMTNGTGGASIHNLPTRDRQFAFTIPIMVDGREIAKATAKYNEKELSRLEKRNNRKRGE